MEANRKDSFFKRDLIVFFCIAAALVASFTISQVKVYTIKGKVYEQYSQKSESLEKKVKKPLSENEKV